MPTTIQQAQITFKTDPRLKDNVLSKARAEGITLKALLTMAMRAYANDRLKVGVYTKVDENFDELFRDKEIVAKANKLGKLLKTKEL